MPEASLYDRIGAAFLEAALTEFYVRAFTDGIIGHLFFGHDRAVITRHQIAFATALLGGPRAYRGRALETVHYALAIRPPHFGRRQMLLREVLDEMRLAPALRDAWLAKEEQLRPLILQPGTPSCGKHERDA
jgi:hemoglobin